MMRRTLARLIAIALAAGALLGSTAYFAYQAGGRVGFEDGYLASALNHDVMNAAVSVKALRSLNAGDQGTAASLLEDTLDGAVVTYWAYSKLDLSRFDPKNRARHADSVASLVAQYRRENPSKNPYEDVRQTVSETIAKLPDPPDCRTPTSH